MAGVFTRSSVNPKHPRDPALAALFGFGNISASGAAITADSSMRVGAVYASVRVLAQAVAQAPLHVYRKVAKGGVERATDHPLYDLLHLKPNDWQTSFEWRETSVAHCALRGDAYSKIEVDSRGRIEKLCVFMVNICSAISLRRGHCARIWIRTRIELLFSFSVEQSCCGRESFFWLYPESVRLRRRTAGLCTGAPMVESRCCPCSVDHCCKCRAVFTELI